MKNITISLLLLLLPILSFSQQVNYTVIVDQMYHQEGGACWEGGNEEYTGKVWFSDNLNGTWVGGQCMQCTTNGNCTNNNDVIIGSRNNTCAETVYIYLQGWEDDRGDRCDYNINGGVFNNDDDCGCGPNNVAAINFRNNPSGTTYGFYYCGSHRTRIKINWNIVPGGAANATCANATAVNAGSTAYTLPTGTCNTDITSCTTNDSEAIWYKYTPTCDFNTTVSTCGSGYDTALSVWSTCGGGGQLACNDDACGLQSSVTIAMTSGTTYYIRVSGFNGGTGSGVLNISAPPALDPGSHSTTAVTSCVGYNPNLPATAATGGSGTYNYQWQVNGANIGGATSEDYNPPAINTAGTYVYRRRVTDACGTILYTNTKTITIVADPAITLAGATTICPGLTANLTASPSGGTGTCSNIWQSGPSSTGPWTTLVTNTSNTYTTAALSTNTYYRVRRDCSPGPCNIASSNSILITAEESTPPVFTTCPGNITIDNDATNCNAVVSWTVPTATDNCSAPSVSGSNNPGETFPLGNTTVTYTADDGNGNTATCSFTITVNDTENPQISCPANITGDSNPGVCGAVITYTTPVGTDNCPGQTTAQTAGLPSGSTFPVGTTTNTFEVTDDAGNAVSCSFTVIITDIEAPQITCPANITAVADLGVCEVAVTYTTPIGTDNCTGQTTVQTAGLASGALYPVGTTTNTFEVTDAAGHTASCSFDVIVTLDGVALDFVVANPNVCLSDGILASQSGGSPVVATNPGDSGTYSGLGVTDNGNGTYDFDPAAAGLGTHNIAYTYSDGAGCTLFITRELQVFESPEASLTCPEPIIKDCEGPFNCHPQDLNAATVVISSGSVSGSALPYTYGDPSPGGDFFIDLPNVPTDTPLELIYTVTTTDGCSSSTSCIFEVASKQANAGKF